MQKKKLTPWQMAGHILHTAILSILAVLMAVLLTMVGCSVLAVSFSSIFYILASGAAGLAVWLVQMLRKRGERK